MLGKSLIVVSMFFAGEQVLASSVSEVNTISNTSSSNIHRSISSTTSRRRRRIIKNTKQTVEFNEQEHDQMSQFEIGDQVDIISDLSMDIRNTDYSYSGPQRKADISSLRLTIRNFIKDIEDNDIGLAPQELDQFHGAVLASFAGGILRANRTSDFLILDADAKKVANRFFQLLGDKGPSALVSQGFGIVTEEVYIARHEEITRDLAKLRTLVEELVEAIPGSKEIIYPWYNSLVDDSSTRKNISFKGTSIQEFFGHTEKYVENDVLGAYID